MDNPAFPFAPADPFALPALVAPEPGPAVVVAAPPAASEADPAIVAPAAAAPAAPAPVEAPAQVAAVANAAPASIARIVSDKPRERTVELDWPILFEGVLYEFVTVRRLNTKEVSDFVGSLKKDPKADERRWPMCDVPDAVLDALDDDDALKVDAAVADFLPQRFRRDVTTADSHSA